MTVPSWLTAVIAIAALLLIVVSVVALFRFQGKDHGEHTLSLGLFKISSQSQAGLFLGAGVLLLTLMVLGPQLIDGGGDDGGEATDTTLTKSSDPIISGETSFPDEDDGDAEITTPGGCTVTISNPFASIREEPDPFAQEIRRVPEGSYRVLEVTTETFAGADQRWLRIGVESDEGWIEDNTIMIEDRSSDCDF